MGCTGSHVDCIRIIQLFNITFRPFVTLPKFTFKLGRSEVPAAAVSRLDSGAIHGQEFSTMKAKPPAELNKFTEHLPEGCPAGAPEVGIGPEVWTQSAQQPDQLKFAACFRFQPTA